MSHVGDDDLEEVKKTSEAASSLVPNGPLQKAHYASLWDHQRRAVSCMAEREGHLFRQTADPLYHNLGIFADDIGSGKTRSVLTLVALKPLVELDYRRLVMTRTSLPACLVFIVSEYAVCDWPKIVQDALTRHRKGYNGMSYRPFPHLFYSQTYFAQEQEQKAAAAAAAVPRRGWIHNVRSADPVRPNLSVPDEEHLSVMTGLVRAPLGDGTKSTHPTTTTTTTATTNIILAPPPPPAPPPQTTPACVTTMRSNLVVVPFTLFKQWKQEIEQQFDMITVPPSPELRSLSKKVKQALVAAKMEKKLAKQSAASEASEATNGAHNNEVDKSRPPEEKENAEDKKKRLLKSKTLPPRAAIERAKEEEEEEEEPPVAAAGRRRRTAAAVLLRGVVRQQQQQEQPREGTRPSDKEKKTKQTQQENKKPPLSCMFINTINDLFDRKRLAAHDLVLCNSRKYNTVAAYCAHERLQWQRLIFDEAHKIDIARCLPMDAMFYWGMTTTYTALHAIRNIGFVRTLYGGLALKELEAITVRTATAALDPRASLYKPFLMFTVHCKATAATQIINHCYPNTPLAQLMSEELYDLALASLRRSPALLNAANSAGEPLRMAEMGILELQFCQTACNRTLSVFVAQVRHMILLEAVYHHSACVRCGHKTSRLTCTSSSSSASYRSSCCGLLYCLKCAAVDCHGNNNRLMDCPLCFQGKVQMRPNASEAEEKGVVVLRTLKRKITRLQQAMKKGKNKLNLDAIGYEQLIRSDNATSSSSSSLRGSQVTLHETRTQCRRAELQDQVLDTRINAHVTKLPCTFIPPGTVNRLQGILEIVKHHQGSRILISTSDIESASHLSNALTQLLGSDRGHKELKGGAGRITNLLKRFGARTCPILILNGQHTGNGLNVPMADVIIVGHIKSEQLLLQLIGRAQRPNRDPNDQLLVYTFEFAAADMAPLQIPPLPASAPPVPTAGAGDDSASSSSSSPCCAAAATKTRKRRTATTAKTQRTRTTTKYN